MELTDTTIVQVPELLNHQSIWRLCAEIEAGFNDPSSAIVLLHGSGDVFCRGLDLGEAANGGDARQAVEKFSSLLHSIRSGSKPAVALVNGTAVAGGFGLACACDVVVATQNATFAMTELLFGLLPAMIFPYVAQRATVQRVRRMALTARPLSAREAYEWGIVDEVCSREETDKVLRSWVRQLRRIHPGAAAIWKKLTASPTIMTSREAIEATLQQLTDAAVRDGLREFIASGSLPFLR